MFVTITSLVHVRTIMDIASIFSYLVIADRSTVGVQLLVLSTCTDNYRTLTEITPTLIECYKAATGGMGLISKTVVLPRN